MEDFSVWAGLGKVPREAVEYQGKASQNKQKPKH